MLKLKNLNNLIQLIISLKSFRDGYEREQARLIRKIEYLRRRYIWCSL